MIRKFRENDLSAVMEIWLDTNICAHNFISKNYWLENYETVKTILPQAEIYVYEEDNTKQIIGFIGLSGDYIEGLFVRNDMQEKGFGKQLLDYVKANKIDLKLSVYQQNVRAIHFYEREEFVIESEKIDVNTNKKEFLMAWSTYISGKYFVGY